MKSNNKDKIALAIGTVMPSFLDAYSSRINIDRFQGGWATSPTFPKTDYEDYASWLIGKYHTPADLGRFVLIGANKVFGVLDTLGNYIQNQLGSNVDSRDIQRAIDLRLSNGVSIMVDNPKDVDHYAYKELYIADPSGETIHTRAADTREFKGFELLSPKGESIHLKTTVKRMESVLRTFKRLHREVERGLIRFNLDVPLNVQLLLRE